MNNDELKEEIITMIQSINSNKLLLWIYNFINDGLNYLWKSEEDTSK